MTKTTKNAKHMRQNTNLTSAQKRRTRVVALALAGVLAIGGVGAVCIAGAAKSPGQAPVVAVQQQQGNGQIQKAVVRKDSSQTNAKSAAKQAAKQTAQQSTSQAQKPATKQTAKQAASQAQKSVAKQTAKPVAKQVAQKNTSQAQKNVAKPAVQQTAQQAASQPAKPTVQQAAQQGASQVVKPAVQQTAQQGGSGSGLEAKISREQCISTACAHVGASGQAKGEARNVTARQVTGGGTVYYVVELDLGEVHYVVNVDAIDGGVIGSDCTHAGKRVLLDKNGDPIEGTEQPVDA